jgi:hypothetical protein
MAAKSGDSHGQGAFKRMVNGSSGQQQQKLFHPKVNQRTHTIAVASPLPTGTAPVPSSAQSGVTCHAVVGAEARLRNSASS